MTMMVEKAVARSIELPAWFNLAVAILLLNSGNLLLDHVAKGARITPAMFFSIGFIVAIACLGSAFLFYVRSLAKLPLAVAYPVMVGLSMIIVAIANHFWGTRALSSAQVTGAVVLFFGVVLISTRAPDARTPASCRVIYPDDDLVQLGVPSESRCAGFHITPSDGQLR